MTYYRIIKEYDRQEIRFRVKWKKHWWWLCWSERGFGDCFVWIPQRFESLEQAEFFIKEHQKERHGSEIIREVEIT